MSSEKLGTKIDSSHERDAVHVAIAPIEALVSLNPGQHVGLSHGKADPNAEPIGVVDPFLTERVHSGEWFWLCLYPQTVTGMRHQWQHPAFGAQARVRDLVASQDWLKNFAATHDCPDYETLLAVATGQYVAPIDEGYGPQAYHNDGEYIIMYGRDAHSEIPAEFWDHIETVTGFKIPQDQRAVGFSCSC
jgi:hypothetical protein